MHPTQHPSPQQKGSFAGYMVILLLISVFVFANFSILGCTECGGSTSSNATSQTTATPNPVSAGAQTLNARSVYQPGDTVELKLAGGWEGSGNGNFHWDPPKGASNIQFIDLQPEPGGPPFVFKNVSPAAANAGIRVSYGAPQKQSKSGYFYDYLYVYTSEQEYKTSISAHKVSDIAAQGEGLEAQAGPEEIEVRANASTPVEVWRLVRFNDFSGHLDQSVCQEIVAQGKSANNFMAWRIPITDSVHLNQSYTLPLITTGNTQPKMLLSSGMLSLEMPLEIRAPATQWANANLPAADGQLWIALGVRPDAVIDCPTMDRDGYSLVTMLSFDLSSRPQACDNCVLPMYSCYKTGAGETMPTTLLGPELTSVLLDDNTNCLGPSELPLIDGATSNWSFAPYTASLSLKPGDPIAIHYWIINNASYNQTFTWIASSNLAGVDWKVYPGTPGDNFSPDLEHPLNGDPLVIAPGYANQYHLHVRGTVPSNAAEQQYLYTLTLNGNTAVPAAWRGSTVIIVTSDGELPDPVEPAASVALSGSAQPAAVTANGLLTYHLTVTNNGAHPLTNLVISDTLPANTSYQSCSGGDNCSQDSGTVTWNLATLGAGQTHSMLLVVRVNAGVPTGTQITNNTYSVQTGQGVLANGTAINTPVTQLDNKIYLPHIAP